MLHITTRLATPADLDVLAPLFDAYRQFYAQPADLAQARAFLAERMQRQESVILLAVAPAVSAAPGTDSCIDTSAEDGRVIGFCQLYPTFCSVEARPIYALYDLFVRPEARRSGVGKALLLAAESLAAAHGKCRMDLTTARTNLMAQAWENVAVVGQASQADNQTKAANQPALWLMRLNTLDDAACAQLASVRAAHPQTACVLLYSYGPQTVVQALRRMGCVVRREPLQDDELAELIQAVLTRAQTAGTDAKRLKGSAPDAAPVPPRKYADHTLQRVASLSGTIQCECPRHVAELIAQLANFEQYSQACLNKSPDDARLHAHLHRVSGTARALFEQALEMVARHEGIDLA